MLYLETGQSQPRTLANAFLDALQPAPRTDPRQAALDRMAAYLHQLDTMYGGPGNEDGRFLATTLEPRPPLPTKQPVPQAVSAALDRIFGRQG